jgi:uncharacterized protein (TIGR03437 family)
VDSCRFILLLPFAILLQMSVWTCGAATAPSLSVVSLPELVSLPQSQAAVAWDAHGNVYVATTVSMGEAGISSPSLPVTPGAAQTQPGLGICSVIQTGIIGTLEYYCTDAFILKQQPDGSLVYATYLGGDKQDTVGGIALDGAGNVYVTGTTGGDFPATAGAFLTSMPAGVSSTGFVAKLNPQGTHFVYVTYLPDGGTASGITLDAAGNAYVTGQTAAGDLYAAKLSSDGSKLLYHAVLPGPSAGLAIAIDSNDSIYVTGQTASSKFPVSPGAFQNKLTGCPPAASPSCGGNAFVVQLDPSGQLAASTYFGGSGSEKPSAIQVDSAGFIYIAGQTTSFDMPTTPASYEPVALIPLWSSAAGGFAAKFAPGLGRVTYSTYVFSEQYGVANMTMDERGGAYLAGTSGGGMPVTDSAPQPCLVGNEDAFVTHLDQNGALVDRTYFNHAGFLGFDRPIGLQLAGEQAVTLVTNSGALATVQFGDASAQSAACLAPFVMGAATFYNAGASSAQFLPDGSPISPGPAVAPGELISLSGLGMGPNDGVVYELAPDGTVPRQLAGVQVFFDEIAAPLLYVQSQQINAIAPFELAGRTTSRLTVVYEGATIGSMSVSVELCDPQLFRLQAGLSTQAAALNQDGTVNGPSNPAAAGSSVELFGTGFGPDSVLGVTGTIAPQESAQSLLDVGVQLNGSPAPVPYAGTAPGLLAGVGQIDIIVPQGLGHGPVSVNVVITLHTGVQYSNSTSTIFVK